LKWLFSLEHLRIIAVWVPGLPVVSCGTRSSPRRLLARR